MSTLVKHSGIPLGSLVLVRIPRSHRQQGRFEAHLGRKPEYLYSFHFGGNFMWLNEAEYTAAKFYCTRARVDQTKLLKCWNW